MENYDKSNGYELKVINTFVDGDTSFYIVEDKNTRYKVRMYDFQKKLKLPSMIMCRVTDFEVDGSPVFEQDKYRVLVCLYVVGEIYSFKVGNRIESSGNGKDYYVLYDNYGFSFRLPVWKRELLNENKKLFCQVTDILPNGILRLKPDADSVLLKSNYISYPRLLQTLNIDEEIEEVAFETLKKERAGNTKVNSLFIQYEQYNGLWVISYVSLITIQKKKAINEGFYALADRLNILYCRIAEWILEDSDFLTVYSPEMTSTLRSKIEEELDVAKDQMYAYKLIRLDQAENYFLNIINKIKVSGYICNRKTRIKTILYLSFFSPDLLNKHASDFLFFIYYLYKQEEHKDIQSLLGIINKFITSESGELNMFLNFGQTDEAAAERIWVLIRYLAVSLLLNRKEQDIRVRRSILYRCLCGFETPENRPVFIRKAIGALFSVGGYSIEFDWDDIIYFNALSFIAKVRSFINAEEIPYAGTQSFVTPYACINADAQKVMIFPRRHPSVIPLEIISLYNGRICIGVSKKEKKNWLQTSDLGNFRHLWDHLLMLFYEYTSLPSAVVPKDTPVGKSLLVRVQGFNKKYPQMVFADIDDECYKGTGILHVSNISHYYVSSLENLFLPNDTFRVTVISAEDGKIQFSLLDELDRIAASKFKPGDYIVARLVRVVKNCCTWVNENGYVMYTEKSEDKFTRIGMSATLLIDGIMADNRIMATCLEESSVEIDEIDALRFAVEEYINYSQVDELEKEIEEADAETEDSPHPDAGNISDYPLINTEFLRELIYIQFLSIACQANSVDRYIHIGTARLLSFISGYKSYAEFFLQYMNYEESLYHFLYDKTTVANCFDFSVTAEAASRFPIMKRWAQVAEVLKSWNKMDREEVLHAYTKDPDLLVASLSRLVLSNNLLSQTITNENTLLSLKTEIARLLKFEMNDETASPIEGEVVRLTNLGLEDGEKEFKASLVYVAGKSMEANMSQQTKVILKAITGFLNSNGGVLYIGVRDTGDVIGLKADFDYMKCGEDGYERLIRSRIVSTLGKDINGLISFKFVTYGDRVICEIHVPRYSKLVSFEDVVWQRQGNETRMLEGVSLLLQEERRQEEEKQKKMSLHESGQVAVPDAGKEDKKIKSKKEKPAVNRIPTSLLRINQLDSDTSDKEVIAFWSILESGEYIITNEMPRMSGISCMIAIQENEQDGYFLLGYENGYINKVAVKTILSKKRKYAYKNGRAKEVQLMFISIASDSDLVFIRTIKNDTEFYKMYPVSLLKVNLDLSHKGSPVFSFNFGSMLQWDVVPVSLADQMDRLQNSLLTYQGISVNSNGFDREMKFIREHFLR